MKLADSFDCPISFYARLSYAALCCSALSLTAATLPRPLLTRPAQTEHSVSIIGNFHYFEDEKLEEADQFDGYGIDFELFVPINQTMQFRFILPAYLDGDARLTKPATYQRIDIDGTAGTLDLPSVLFEHQFVSEEASGYNLAYYLGGGTTIREWGKLDTTHGDRFNHQGRLLRYGLKYEHESDNGAARWLANLGVRQYFGSDDLNPAQSGDNFKFLEVMGAGVFDTRHESIFPAVEVQYLSDLENYHALLLVPQAILSVHENIDLKTGVPFRLTNNGESWGVRFQMDASF